VSNDKHSHDTIGQLCLEIIVNRELSGVMFKFFLSAAIFEISFPAGQAIKSFDNSATD